MHHLFQKIRKKIIWSKELKNTLDRVTWLFFCFFECLKCLSLKFGALFITSYNTIIFIFFVSLGNILSLTHCHVYLWSCFFLLMIIVFIKFVLFACDFDVISKWNWVSTDRQMDLQNYLLWCINVNIHHQSSIIEWSLW